MNRKTRFKVIYSFVSSPFSKVMVPLYYSLLYIVQNVSARFWLAFLGLKVQEVQSTILSLTLNGRLYNRILRVCGYHLVIVGMC